MPTLASVIAFKIQGFSSRPVAQQAQLKAQVEALITLAIQPLPATERIVLDISDGMVVVLPDNPDAALALAGRAQVAAAELPLCIGVNHGPVTSATDALRGAGLAGDGLAAGIILAGAAQPGRFVVSRSFHQALQAVSSNRARELAVAGVFTDRNVRTHELFALDPLAAPKRRKRLLLTGALSVIGIIVLGFVARAVVHQLTYVPPAIIKFEIKPAGEIFVDGILKGVTPPLKSLELKPGPHAIEVRNTTFPPLRVNINLAPGEETTVTHTFERPKAVPRPARKQPEPQEKSVGDHFRELRQKMGL
jgi:hypothetical protein